MAVYSAPIAKIISRIKFHKDTGFIPVGSIEPTKLLSGLKFFEVATERAEEQEDFPNLTVQVPLSAEQPEPQRFMGEVQVELNLSTDYAKGLTSEDRNGIIDWYERIVGALRTDETGKTDTHLGHTTPKQIAFSLLDGVSTGTSITATILIKFTTKPYVQP